MTRRLFAGLSMACSVAALVIACSSFGDESLPPSPEDSATSQDASTADTPSVIDAPGPDAPDAPEDRDGGGRSCAQPGHLLCDDFDLGTTIAKWGIATAVGGDVQIQAIAEARSLPNVLDVTSVDASKVDVHITLPVTKKGVTCSFAVRLLTRPTGTSAQLMQLDLSGKSYYRVELRAGAGPDDGFLEYGGGPDAGDFPPFGTVKPIGAGWHRVRVELRLGLLPRLVVTMDGDLVISAPKYDLASLTPPNQMSLTLGASGFGPTGGVPWHAQFDDVVCDESP